MWPHYFQQDQVPCEPHNLNPLISWLVSPEFLQSNPIWVYSLTCHWNFKEEADLAAPYTSDFDIMASVHEEDIRRMKAMELCCILILGNQWYLNSLGYIHTTPTACIACPNSTVFYTVLCYGLLLQLDIDWRVLYDHRRCISRCYKIAKEVETFTGVVACVTRPEFHLMRFIESLAAKFTNHSWTLFEGSILPLFSLFCALNLRLDGFGLCWVLVLLSVPILKSTQC